VGIALLAIIAAVSGFLEEVQERQVARLPVNAAILKEVPRGPMVTYWKAARDERVNCKGLSWEVLAAIGKIESDHGRSHLPGVRSGWNEAGAAGPMQIGIGTGRAGNSWRVYGRDWDKDGRRSVYDSGDAIPAAAQYLCKNGYAIDKTAAVYAYNQSMDYVRDVFAKARHYRKLAYPNN
jgi:hypothetical protein